MSTVHQRHSKRCRVSKRVRPRKCNQIEAKGNTQRIASFARANEAFCPRFLAYHPTCYLNRTQIIMQHIIGSQRSVPGYVRVRFPSGNSRVKCCDSFAFVAPLFPPPLEGVKQRKIIVIHNSRNSWGVGVDRAHLNGAGAGWLRKIRESENGDLIEKQWLWSV